VISFSSAIKPYMNERKTNLLEFYIICIGSYYTKKIIYANNSTIFIAAEISNIGFYRENSPLQNVLYHQTVEYSHFHFLKNKSEHPHIYHRSHYSAKIASIRAMKNNHSYMAKCATLWGTRICNQI